MRLRGHSRRNAGLTLIELVLAGAVVSFLGLMVVKYSYLPARLTSLMTNLSNQEGGYKDTALPVDDLKSAIAVSIQWAKIDPSQDNTDYDPAANPNYIPWFQVNDPAIVYPALPLSYVCYAYRAADQALVRYFISGAVTPPATIDTCSPILGDNAQEKIIAKNLLAPTVAEPLFKKDFAASNMVILTLRFKDKRNAVTTIVRRAHIRT